MAFTVTLSDGTQLSGLELNGNNFISRNEISSGTFDGKLKHVVITGDKEADMEGLIGEHSNMELVRCQYDEGLGGWAFVLREIPASTLRELRIDARLDYIEMMEGL
ncbi:MAG: hypothetical protein IJQ74_00135 [Synergistaceae bacterium]|nr:hypothetical protein [Synergistaceae bacterium]